MSFVEEKRAQRIIRSQIRRKDLDRLNGNLAYYSEDADANISEFNVPEELKSWEEYPTFQLISDRVPLAEGYDAAVALVYSRLVRHNPYISPKAFELDSFRVPLQNEENRTLLEAIKEAWQMAFPNATSPYEQEEKEKEMQRRLWEIENAMRDDDLNFLDQSWD